MVSSGSANARGEERMRARARGMDTQAMVPVFAALYEVLSMLFLPWLSVPEMKYSSYISRAGILKMAELGEGLAATYGIPDRVASIAASQVWWIRAAAIAAVVLTLLFIPAAYRWKRKAAWYGRAVFAIDAVIPTFVFYWSLDTNRVLNILKGAENTFSTLTVKSTIQLTAYAYASVLVGAAMVFAAGRLLDTAQEYAPEMYISRTMKEDDRISRRTVISLVIIAAAIPAVIVFGILFLNDRSIYFISLCVILLSMLPFFMVFEHRRPEAREVVVIAVLAAMAAIGRTAFFWLPFFKPMAAVVIITGVALGAEAGFLTGAMAAFVSNFLFGQGPWTPWQMYAFGIVGFLAGILFRRARERGKDIIWLMCVYGFVSVLGIYGVIMDVQAVTMSMSEINKAAFLAYFATGFPVNLIHAAATFLFIRILGGPLLRKLTRIKVKYGIVEP